MRTTQFIGMTQNAKEYAKMMLVPDHFTTHNNFTTGMFDEKIPLQSWNNGTYIEKVQAEPWSSGPMIFTAIWDTCTKEWIQETLWIEGTPEDSEYDFVSGRFYV
jgi:hypothetical protein